MSEWNFIGAFWGLETLGFMNSHLGVLYRLSTEFSTGCGLETRLALL